jgi:glycosyltransferase involved in cell wall biosynthesis
MRYLKAAIGSDLSALGIPCVYDAEAVFALRELGRQRVAGEPMLESAARELVARELELARGCSAVLTVREAEAALFAESGASNVAVVRHAVHPDPTRSPFERRRTVLFVGSFAAGSPNEDAVRFLSGEIAPALRARGCDAPIVIAGAGMRPELIAAAADGVSWHADVDDLTAFYDDARVFVAPTRFAAGIPLKAIEAAARGIPIVSTPIVAEQLGWTEAEIRTGAAAPDLASAIAVLFADRTAWTRQREAALARVTADFSAARFRASLERAIAPLLDLNRHTRPLVIAAAIAGQNPDVDHTDAGSEVAAGHPRRES